MSALYSGFVHWYGDGIVLCPPHTAGGQRQNRYPREQAAEPGPPAEELPSGGLGNG